MLQERFQEPLDIAPQDCVEATHLKSGARIFDPLIWMKEIVAYLRAESSYRFVLVFGCDLGFSFFFFDSSQSRTQHLPRLRSVFMLAAIVLALNNDTSGYVSQSNR